MRSCKTLLRKTKSTMTEVFDILPGIALPVREVTSQLNSMWEVDDPDFSLTSHTSQMNVVLHFGLDVELERASGYFEALVRFAQRYPCRIIILCPSNADRDNAIESKLFSQCYIGESHREMCCCEAVIVRYHPLDSESLYNQVSTWLEADLPTYCWLNNIPVQWLKSYSKAIQKLGVHRFVFDDLTRLNEFAELDWPQEYHADSLARAFFLPVRQVIGQFLSQYPVSNICEGLKMVRARCPKSSAEGDVLLEWITSCFDACEDCSKSVDCQPEVLTGKAELNSEHSLELEFIYDNDQKYFLFSRSKDGSRCKLKANFGEGEAFVNVPVTALTLEYALAEAFFF